MKNQLFGLVGAAPASWIHLVLGKGCLLPYYHMVSNEEVPHVSSLYAYRNVARFKDDLDLLCRGRKALTLEEFLDTAQSSGQPPQNSFLLTFDDGFREMHDVVFPILAAKGIPAVFFVIAETLDNQALCFQQKVSLLVQHVETLATSAQRTEALRIARERGLVGAELACIIKSVTWAKRAVLDDLARVFEVDFLEYLRATRPYLSSEQIQTLIGRGFAIGAHSIDHPRYADIALEEQFRQTRESMELLVARFPIKRRTFAFPHTDQNVSRKFFETIQDEGCVEATFGTSGPAADTVPRSYQRFSMEKPDWPGKTLLARQGLRQVNARFTGGRKITRN